MVVAGARWRQEWPAMWRKLVGCLVGFIGCVAHAAPAPGMTWVKTECHFFWREDDEPNKPRIVHSLEDLPPEVVAKVNAHLAKRLGRDFFSRLRFEEAHVGDPDAFYKQYPDWDRAKSPLSTYEIAWRVLFDDDAPVDYCARLDVDASGGVVHEIDLPPVARNRRLGQVLPLRDILNLAHSVGVPTDQAYLDMKYDSRSRILQYLVSYFPHDHPEDYNRITLVVSAHDPNDYHWFQSLLMY